MAKKNFFFNANINDEYVPVPFDQSSYDPSSKQYIYTPTRGPLFGGENGMLGFFVVLLFAFYHGLWCDLS